MSQVLNGVFLVNDASQRSLSSRALPSFLGHILKALTVGGLAL